MTPLREIAVVVTFIGSAIGSLVMSAEAYERYRGGLPGAKMCVSAALAFSVLAVYLASKFL